MHLFDKLCIHTPYGARLVISRRDKSEEIYFFRGLDAQGRAILVDPTGHRTLQPLLVYWQSVLIEHSELTPAQTP